MDLPAIEGLADLIAAETESQRRQALAQLEGLLGHQASSWRGRLTEALALVEASIDFSDEDDVPKEALAEAMEIIRPLAEEIESAVAGHGERLREGLRVAIAGPPNAGKSTLFNRLARREAAIVSPYPGTTRDVLELHLDLGGFAVTVLDTAGIRPSDDPVEQEGVRRAAAQAARADLVLWVIDASRPLDGRLAPEAAQGPPRWLVVNKIDLVTSGIQAKLEPEFGPELVVHQLSCRTGAGVEDLVAALAHFASQRFPPEPALVTRERHRVHLRETSKALREAVQVGERGQAELLAEQIRRAAESLGRLLGRVDVEEVLDVIFRDFCIGK
jgi:tRNA modification GTPase